MSVRHAEFERTLHAAEREVAEADFLLRADYERLKAHAGKAGSYSAPLGALGALVAYKVFRRALRRRPKRSALSAAAAPAKVGVAALFLRMGLPGVLAYARDQAMAWHAHGADRSAFPGPGAGIAPGARPLPRVSASLDRARFAGRWFEVARLAGTPPTGGPSPAVAAATLVLVPVPDGFDVERLTTVSSARRGTRVGSRCGVLRPTDPAGRDSELSLSWAPSWSRWLPIAWSDFWILEVDTAYTFALVGDRGRATLSVLSRSPALDEAAWRQLLATASEEGYPVERLERTGVDRV